MLWYSAAVRSKRCGCLFNARILPLALLILAGCSGREFHVDGVLASEGGRSGTWSCRPQGCIRASRVAEGVSDPARVASLLWIDPVRRDASRANGNQFRVADAPIRLDLALAGGEPIAVLETVRTRGTEFNRRNCRTLTLEIQEERPTKPEGRPALAGRVQMDCEVRGSHVTADVRFRGCNY